MDSRRREDHESELGRFGGSRDKAPFVGITEREMCSQRDTAYCPPRSLAPSLRASGAHERPRKRAKARGKRSR